MDRDPTGQMLSNAVRELRTALGDSQEEFAKRLNTAVRTVSRYETDRPPRGMALLRLLKLAMSARVPTAARVFKNALKHDLSVARTSAARGGNPDLGDLIVLQLAGIEEPPSATEQAFLVSALAVYRTANQTERIVMSDFEGLLRRAMWMFELEQKILQAAGYEDPK